MHHRIHTLETAALLQGKNNTLETSALLQSKNKINK
jgi:hypothetical protein